MVQICQSLLKESLLEDAIRAGDCLAMLVEYFHGAGRMQEAYVHLQDMEARNIALHPYVDAQILEEVFKAVGAPEGGVASKQVNKGGSGPRTPSSSGDGGRDTHHDNNNDGIDSDIEEDMGDSPAPKNQKNSGGGNTYNNNRGQPSQSSRAPPTASANTFKSDGGGREEKVDDRRRGGSSRKEEEEEELDEDIDEVRLHIR